MINKQEEIGIMRNQNRQEWPCYPLLPLRRNRDKEPHCAVIVASQGPVVFVANMFALADGTQDLIECEKLEYASFQELVDDGWYVD